MKNFKKYSVFILIIATFLLVGCGKKNYSATISDVELSFDNEFSQGIANVAISDLKVTLDIEQLKEDTQLDVKIDFTAKIPVHYELTNAKDQYSLIWLQDTTPLNEVYIDANTIEVTNGSGRANFGESVSITYKGKLKRKLTNEEIKEMVQMTIYFENLGGAESVPLICKISKVK